MRGIKGLQDVNSDLQLRNPTAYLTIDRDRTAALGVTPESIENALYTAYGSRQISTIYSPNNEYQVIMELMPQFQRDPSAFQLLYVRSRKGDLVPLSALTKLEKTVGPLAVNHAGQLPAVTISFNLPPSVSLGDAVAEINKVARGRCPPPSRRRFQGTAQAFEASQKGLGLLLLVAILVIYMVLGILYEDFLHPLTILSALPFAGFGALLTLLIFKVELSIYAFVGVILLVGLVKKNGIMMVDFAVEGRRAGKSAEDAIYEACVVRFRPIMMTTMAALMGTLPIALGFGAGAEVAAAARPRRRRRPSLLADDHALRHAGLLRLHGPARGVAQAPARRDGRRGPDPSRRKESPRRGRGQLSGTRGPCAFDAARNKSYIVPGSPAQRR